MARVTADEVKEILEVSADVLATTPDLTPFITSANLLVTDLLGTSSLSSDQLKEIERWLAAHFVAIRDPRRSYERAGSVGEGFQHRLGLRLEVTTYGQQAIALDTTGTLADVNETGGKRSAMVKALK